MFDFSRTTGDFTPLPDERQLENPELVPFFWNNPYNRIVKRQSNICPAAEGSQQLPAGLAMTDVLRALSDPVRLQIVRLAAERERACNEFDMDLPKATLSHHFKVLREAGVIRVRADGTRHLTSLNRKALDAKFPGLMKAVLA